MHTHHQLNILTPHFKTYLDLLQCNTLLVEHANGDKHLRKCAATDASFDMKVAKSAKQSYVSA